ncbi:MAG TPA: TetR/AcrR family transcriptional regulator [Streptosporangiaceae bacterium]|nr:TetR/AcrR family transcriptional regulator [Streptosporangiaceae bacterium]
MAAAPDLTPQRILDAVGQLYPTRGYRGTSVSEIAKIVGITPAALYYHFPSKAEIFAAFLEESISSFVAGMEALRRGESPSDDLYAVVHAHVLSQLKVIDRLSPLSTTTAMTQLVAELPSALEQRVRKVERGYLELLQAIIIQGNAEGTFDVDQVIPTVFALINLSEYVITWFRPDGLLSPEDVAHHHACLALRMVGATKPAQRRKR